jgi:hypothetical protein
LRPIADISVDSRHRLARQGKAVLKTFVRRAGGQVKEYIDKAKADRVASIGFYKSLISLNERRSFAIWT